jgi:hypothetical protein
VILRLNNFFSSKKHLKFATLGTGIVVLVGMVLYVILSMLGIHWPSEAEIIDLKSTLKRQQHKLVKVQKDAERLDVEQQALGNLTNNFWSAGKDRHIDVEMRRKIEEYAKNAGLSLQSMGNIRTGKLAQGFNKLEITISANAPLDKVIHFLSDIRQAKPDFFWQQCSIRPDNMTNPDKVYLNGTLSVISIDKQAVEKFFKRGSK